MLTPPHHFSIAACPPNINDKGNNEILYRGAIPAARNIPFLKRLNIRTIVYLKKKEIKQEEPIARWAKRHGVEMRWVKVDKMGEENLGMSRVEIGEVIKLLLNPSLYPLYLTDKDGISHTTLVIACLRKLQGWAPDAILSEICRFEPDHEDLPLVPFITSYLTSGPSTETLSLPSGPYPSWLWPVAPPSAPVITPTSSTNLSRNNTVSKESRNREKDSGEVGSGKEREQPNAKDRERERTVSVGSTASILPFPHPVTARRHPTMKLTFPAPVISTPPVVGLSRVNSRRERSERERERDRERLETAGILSPSNAVQPASSALPHEDSGLVATATSLLSAGLGGIAGVIGSGVDLNRDPETPDGSDIGRSGLETGKITRMVSFHDDHNKEPHSTDSPSSNRKISSPEKSSRTKTLSERSDSTGITTGAVAPQSEGKSGRPRTDSTAEKLNAVAYEDPEEYDVDTNVVQKGREDGSGDSGSEGGSSSGSIGGSEDEDYDDDDEDEEEEEDDEDEDGEIEPTALHISALDLAGYG